MKLNCTIERQYMGPDDVLPEGTPIVSCLAFCPKCGDRVVGTFIGHVKKPPKQIEHQCEGQNANH